ncbi:MAG: diaminopimelate decarboxylase [Micavibrio sp. TMED27]|nr:diaminopimelate decarboxylase [Micavibrio sp.]OUT91956.1 MAG: diaminopimelate decarboxylase [Micavibrio sp. TMED27]|tara:strand:- start:711 stop:1979 length:1269 start_codon:yes stop_codon:yes gene_type:complete
MIGFNEKDGVLHADNVPLTQLAEEFGTPLYVYSAGVIRAQYKALSDAMANALPKDRQPLLCYACKANSNLAVLSVLQKSGSGLEIVSEGELRRGLKAGFNPETIVSTGVGKQASEIKACLEAGIHQFNVESLPELFHIQRIAEGLDINARVVFRLNPDVTGGGHHKISTGRSRDKFGIGHDRVFEGFEIAKDMSHVEAVGLSMHIGSQVFTVETFKEAFEKLPALVKELRGAGHTIERLDIGGGFPIVYDDEKLLDLSAYAQWVNDIVVPLDTEIIMEPGRYMVGNAGVLLSEVLYIKETHERNFLIIDAAMNDLIRPTLYDAYHGIEAVENRDLEKVSYDVVGPVCETGDTFSTGRSLPLMNEGDLAVIKSTGAYGFCMASNYNTRPMPAEVLVDGDQYSLIKPRQSYEDLIDNDIVPDFL